MSVLKLSVLNRLSVLKKGKLYVIKSGSVTIALLLIPLSLLILHMKS